MTAADVQAQIDKIDQEIVHLKAEIVRKQEALERELMELKAEIYDRKEAIKHLEVVRDAMAESEAK